MDYIFRSILRAQHGESSERVALTWLKEHYPQWFIKATEKWSTLDMKGVDIVATQGSNKVMLFQVKSTINDAEKRFYEYTSKGIGLVVVEENNGKTEVTMVAEPVVISRSEFEKFAE